VRQRATTAQIENEAVSRDVGGALNQRPRDHRQAGGEPEWKESIE
jgi:hypothetical protein